MTFFRVQWWSSRFQRQFLDIKSNFDLPGTSYFLYLRLRSAMKAYGVPWDQQIPEHPMEKWVRPMQNSRGTVTVIYNAILLHHSGHLAVERAWERELITLGPAPLWEKILENLSSASKNLAHQLIHFKLIHRAYTTPSK